MVIAVIHLEDQNWFSFEKTPGYVQVGYVLLEIVGLVTAWLLLTRPDRTAWLLAAGVGLAPFVGYVLSRGPGLPGYTDDKGAWSEPLGVVSLIVEGLLFLTALVALTAPSAPEGRAAQRQAGAPAITERDHAIR
ncbi:hypothetical protein [Pseudofrankia sp. DC12]|uniref:hypothetical protein n=1 Tax=Pseudofrankia sp. DC12 TaxID=683315 RepID=UPI001E390EB2|nr:hypothetical protein [Pseudofrankia sp. DC12]